jgi:hypothetical protein
MYEIYKISTDKVILSGLSLRQAEHLRLNWVDQADLIVRPMT